MAQSDDALIDAMLDAWFPGEDWKTPSVAVSAQDNDHFIASCRRDMRAVLAVASKHAADRIERLEAALAEAQFQVEGYEEAQASKQALTRQIAVLIDGDGAAKQPSLCDIVPMVRELVAERDAGFKRGVEEGAAAGWNACRKLATAGCAIVEAKAAEALTCGLPAHVEGFHRGEETAARSLAKGLAAIEAKDDSHFREALRVLAGDPS